MKKWEGSAVAQIGGSGVIERTRKANWKEQTKLELARVALMCAPLFKHPSRNQCIWEEPSPSPFGRSIRMK